MYRKSTNRAIASINRYDGRRHLRNDYWFARRRCLKRLVHVEVLREIQYFWDEIDISLFRRGTASLVVCCRVRWHTWSNDKLLHYLVWGRSNIGIVGSLIMMGCQDNVNYIRRYPLKRHLRPIMNYLCICQLRYTMPYSSSSSSSSSILQ